MQKTNKKNIKAMNTIELPFDGTAKCCDEIASMIGNALTKTKEERVDILFPVQWAMSPANILHPDGGVLAHLHKDEAINAAYKFTGFARNGALGVTAVRSC